MKRIFRHSIFSPLAHWRVSRLFPKSALQEIENAIKKSEKLHSGEVAFAVEAKLSFEQIMHGVTGRDRALQVFSDLRIWDTEANNGVLVYLLVADRDIEIIADRGIYKKIGSDRLNSICAKIESSFRANDFKTGILEAIGEITEILIKLYPPDPNDINEISNKPVIL